MCKLNKLKQPMGQRRNYREIRKYLEMDENTMH